jgi:hypothetical protein
MVVLGQPPTGQAEGTDVLNALKSHVRVVVEQQAAAHDGGGLTFTKDWYEGNRLRTRCSVRPMPPTF